MSNLAKDILSNIGNENLDKLFSKYNIPSDKKEKVSENLTSLFLGGMTKNAQKGGAEKLVKVLTEDHKETLNKAGDILDGKFSENGAKILKHVFGDKENKVLKTVSKELSKDKSTTLEMLKDFGPMVLGGFSKTTQKSNVQDSNVLTDLLKMATSSDLSKNKSLFMGFLDLDGDGQIVDDIPILWKKLQKLLAMFKK
ncbi:hypothetical protein CSB11_01170 [Candidatus Campbellbacteria bacterium]|nr:MAG: hypothetical protein CSB11_01170 [Candidatus Campbellbacteria bacterium]